MERKKLPLAFKIKRILRKLKHVLPKDARRRFLILFVALLALPLSVTLVQQAVLYFSRAQTVSANLYFQPSTANLPPNTNLRLMIDARTNRVGFVAMEVSFDRTKVNLTNEITTTTLLKTVISRTSRADANATGRITIVLGLSPDDRNNPPTGIFEFAQIPFGVVTTQQNQTADIAFVTTGIQIVDVDNYEIPYTSTAARLTLNPTTTNSPTPTVRPTNTPTPVAGATNTPTPTPRPTNTPTPGPNTPTPVPTSSTEGSVTVQINNIANDVNEDGSTYTENGSAWIGNGASTTASYTGLRFTGVNIPRGSTITSVRLDVKPNNDTWTAIAYTLRADRVGNSAIFSSSSKPSSRTLTSASFNHSSNVSWTANTWYSFSGFQSVIQEIVNRSDWNQGNSLSLILKGTGNAYGRKYVYSYNTSPANAPRIVVNFNPPSTTSAPTATTGLISTPTVRPNTPTPTPTPALTSSPVGTYNFVPTEDASVKSAYPNSNYGNLTYLTTSNYASYNTIITYLKFDLSSLAGKTITSARIKFTPALARTIEKTLKTVSSNTWSQSTITWNNRPAIGSIMGSIANQSVYVGVPIEVSINTSSVQSAVGGIYSLAVDNASSNNTFEFNSREAASGKPELIISTSTGSFTVTPRPTNTPTVTPRPTNTPTPGPTIATSPTATPPVYACSTKPGDVNNDGKVDILDIIEIVKVYLQQASANPCADLNRDGIINILDIVIVIEYYGS